MPLVMGVDSPTQATKVEVRDADTGRLVARGRAPHPAVSPPCSEQDPESWWRALEAARAEAAVDEPIGAISVAAQQHGLVVLDERDEVIRPAKLWNDTQSAADADWLVGQLDGGPAAWAAACGSVPVAAFTITKLSWLHRKEPDAFARIRSVMLPHDWLAFRLTGERTTDRGDASGTGYWSPPEGRWRLDLLGIVDGDLDWARALPEVLGPEDALGTGDNMAGALGIGLAPGDVAISIGTSGTVYAVSDRPAADATGAVAGFADATGRFLPLVCTLNATRVTDAFARLLGLDRERFHAAALEAPRGAGGVTLLPYLDGERTPNRPDATGTIGGLRADVSREQLARAAVEGVACGLLDGLDALRTAGVDVDGRRLVLLGGGARSAAYRRVLADLSGRTLTVAPDAEEVALGACVQAASRLHGRPASEVQRAWGLGSGDVVEPDAAAADVASEIRARYAALRDGG